NPLALDRRTQSIGNLTRRIHHRAREQHDEFVACITTDHVTATNTALEQGNDGFENVVTLQVPVGVVDELEVIDVDDEERRWRVVCATALERIVRRVEERAAPGHAGE